MFRRPRSRAWPDHDGGGLSVYELLCAMRPDMAGLPIIAIIEPDGHLAAIPVAVGILDDEPMAGVVKDMFGDLLEARAISKARASEEVSSGSR